MQPVEDEARDFLAENNGVEPGAREQRHRCIGRRLCGARAGHKLQHPDQAWRVAGMSDEAARLIDRRWQDFGDWDGGGGCGQHGFVRHLRQQLLKERCLDFAILGARFYHQARRAGTREIGGQLQRTHRARLSKSGARHCTQMAHDRFWRGFAGCLSRVGDLDRAASRPKDGSDGGSNRARPKDQYSVLHRLLPLYGLFVM